MGDAPGIVGILLVMGLFYYPRVVFNLIAGVALVLILVRLKHIDCALNTAAVCNLF